MICFGGLNYRELIVCITIYKRCLSWMKFYFNFLFFFWRVSFLLELSFMLIFLVIEVFRRWVILK